MPAVSKSQQALFGMAYAVRKGEMKRSDVHKEVLDIVDSDMTDKQIKDFASTSRKSLKESLLDALDDERMEDMAMGAIHADVAIARKRLRQRRSDGSKDMFGQTLRPYDPVLFVTYVNNQVLVAQLINKVRDGWVSDITIKEAARLFDTPESSISDYYNLEGDKIVLPNYSIICKVKNKLNKLS